jgi:hypothetical protein
MLLITVSTAWETKNVYKHKANCSIRHKQMMTLTRIFICGKMSTGLCQQIYIHAKNAGSYSTTAEAGISYPRITYIFHVQKCMYFKCGRVGEGERRGP